jgi:hypothetical protein
MEIACVGGLPRINTGDFCKESAEGGIRTPTPYGATPSRWCVCQFRHFRTEGEGKDCSRALKRQQAPRAGAGKFYFGSTWTEEAGSKTLVAAARAPAPATSAKSAAR